MKFQKIPLLFLLGVGSAVGPSWSAIDDSSTQAYFATVQGKVKILRPSQTEARNAHTHSKVNEGDRITTGKKSKATLVMFDGSELEIAPESSMTIAKLQKPSELDKILQFKLLVGHLLAKVKKLTSTQSSFEIQAGGVVCGVRGTEFAIQYLPKTHSLFVNVLEGSVYTRMGQKEITIAAGQRAHFTHVPSSVSNSQGSSDQGSSSNGKKGLAPNTSGQNNNGTGSTSQSTNSTTANSNGTGNNNETTSDTNSGANGNSGNTNGSENPTTGSSNSPSPGSQGNGSTVLQTNSALGDLNNQFVGGILINGENNLTQAQQTLNIHVVVPPGEAVP